MNVSTKKNIHIPLQPSETNIGRYELYMNFTYRSSSLFYSVCRLEIAQSFSSRQHVVTVNWSFSIVKCQKRYKYNLIIYKMEKSSKSTNLRSSLASVLNKWLQVQQVSRTWLQATCGSRPAHDGRYRTHHCSHPGVGDAEPLERCVATSVEEDVEGAQEARQGVYPQREQSDSGNSTGQGKGHCMEGTGARKGEKRKEKTKGEIMRISQRKKKINSG